MRVVVKVIFHQLLATSAHEKDDLKIPPQERGAASAIVSTAVNGRLHLPCLQKPYLWQKLLPFSTLAVKHESTS